MRRIDLAEHLWSDPRGWGLEALEAAGLPATALGNLHVVSMTPGAVRGQHLHTTCTEWLLITHGPVELAWQGPLETEPRIEDIDDFPALFEIPPSTAHAVRNPGHADIFLLSFSNREDRDTIAVPDLFAALETSS